jgi:branched-chain amino acid transport system substrate-binding protein
MKKLFYLLTLVLLVLAGCNNSSSATSGNIRSGTIKMGYYGPLTGPSSLLGTDSRNGAALAVEQINQKGGVLGKKIELIEMDDKSSPEQAVKNVTKMVGVDKVDVIVGSIHSGNILSSAPIIEKAKIPEIGNGTSPSYLQKGYKFIFRSVPNSDWSNPGLLNGMKELKIKKVGILYRNDEYGKTGSAALIKNLQANGIEVVDTESHQPGDTDFTGQITKLLHSGADAMVAYSITEDMAIEMKQFRQQGYNGYVFGPEAFSSPQVYQVAGKSANKAIFAAAYVIPSKPEDATTDKQKAFLQAYLKKYGKMPSSDQAYRSYDAVNIFAFAIKEAGTTNGEKVRNAIENITNYQGLAGTFNYKGHNGEGIQNINTFIINNGKFELLKDYMKNN